MNTCWILTDGRTGTENNARGLAEALGLAYEVKPITLRQPWKTLSPWLRLGLSQALPSSAVNPPWPDLLITAGRTPAVGSLHIGQKSPHTLRVHITNPGISPDHFDLVIAPAHDALPPHPHLLTTTGALHRISPEKLAQAKALWEPRFAHLPRPWHAVLIGGAAHGLTLDASTLSRFMSRLQAMGGSTLATASRRTDEQARAVLASSATYLWDGTGDNPYLGLLACADAVFVTSDSVSMLSEAAASGKPVGLLRLPGHAPKLARCHTALLEGGFVAELPESGRPLPPTRQLDDMKRAVERVKELILARTALVR